MPDDHPTWCSPRRCTATRQPMHGHALATHRSAPEALGLAEAYLIQSPGASTPVVEVVRAGRSVTLPLLEAQSLPAALEDLLGQAGL